MLLEWRGVEEDLQHAVRVFLELRRFGRRVTVAEDKKIDVRGRVAGILQLEQRRGWLADGAVDELVVRVDVDGPEFAEGVLVVALLEDDLHGMLGRGEAQRFREGAADFVGLVGGLPFTEDGSESAGVEQLVGGAVAHLEVVLAEIGVVDGLGEIAGPGQRFEDDVAHAEELGMIVAGVVVVEAHGARRGGEQGNGGNENEERKFAKRH